MSIMDDDDNEINVFELPEGDQVDVINKIHSLAKDIRMDWSDPRYRCKEIYRLCDKLKSLLNLPL